MASEPSRQMAVRSTTTRWTAPKSSPRHGWRRAVVARRPRTTSWYTSYDENGAPIGLQYRNKTYGTYTFDTYYFEKNLQGDIIAIYTENGTKIGSYTYDAWGNCTSSYATGATILIRSFCSSVMEYPSMDSSTESDFFFKERCKRETQYSGLKEPSDIR